MINYTAIYLYVRSLACNLQNESSNKIKTAGLILLVNHGNLLLAIYKNESSNKIETAGLILLVKHGNPSRGHLVNADYTHI